MATYTSVKDGDWNDPTVWGSASYPSVAGDIVIIKHNVQYNVNSPTQMGDITISDGGKLYFSKTMNTRLALGHKNLNVGDNVTEGKLVLGDSLADPIPKEYTAIIEFATTSDNAKGILFNYNLSSWPPPRGGWISVNGDPEYYGSISETTIASDWTSGNIITVVGNLVNKWRIGQQLVLQNIYDFPPSASPQSVATKIQLVTIAAITANGDNTNIQINESYANPFPAGSIVTNLSRNVIIRKVGASTALSNYNTNRPKITGKTNYSYPDQINNFNNVDFTGFYSINDGSFYTTYNNCVVRNGYIGHLDFAFRQIVTITEQGFTIDYSRNIVTNGIFFSITYPFSGPGGSFIKIDNSRFISNLYVCMNAGNMEFRDCKFNMNNIVAYDSRQMRFYNCDFNQNGYTCYRSTNMEFYNCMFWKQNRLCNRGGPYKFFNSFLGCDRNENDELPVNEVWGEPHALYGSEIWFDNCVGKFYYYAAQDALDITKMRHCKQILNYQAIMDNWGEFMSYLIDNDMDIGLYNSIDGQGRVQGIWFCKKDTTDKNVGDDSQHFKITFPDTIYHYPINDFQLTSVKELNLAPGTYKRKFFIKTTNFASWPAGQLFLKAEYPGTENSWDMSEITSTQVPTANGTWTELSVEFTTHKTGHVTYSLHLVGFPTLITSEETIYAHINIDSAVWISDTQYIKLPWDFSDWQECFTIPDFPIEANVRKNISYNDNQFEGTLDLPAVGVVREGIQFDNATKEGTLSLPAVEDVATEVQYGTNGTEFTGTFERANYGQVIAVEVEYE